MGRRNQLRQRQGRPVMQRQAQPQKTSGPAPSRQAGQQDSRPEDLSAAVLELMTRYELGHFEPRIRARLAEIFRDDPPDAVARLEKAAEYIGVDGQELNTWDAEARKQARLLAGKQNSRIET